MSDMRRREFISLLGGASAAWPLVARAQQPAMPARIGWLGLGLASAYTKRVELLRAGLRDLGYAEGRNLVFEFRWAETVDQLPALAADLVRMNVDVIFASSSTEVEAARHLTTSIPIVFATHADPVGVGHVTSLARPGGNITGRSVLLTDLVTKQLEILKEALPHAKRIGVLWNPTAPSHVPALKAIETAGDKLGLQLVMAPSRTAEDFNGAFVAMKREHANGCLVVSSPLFSTTERSQLAGLMLKRGLPGMFGSKENVEAGGLMSYSADFHDQIRRVATYIDRILKGAKPSNLPVEQASKYELVINLKTARALGLEVPPTLLARADEVIE
jgi:putative ABC transport system substrate-binding protein